MRRSLSTPAPVKHYWILICHLNSNREQEPGTTCPQPSREIPSIVTSFNVVICFPLLFGTRIHAEILGLLCVSHECNICVTISQQLGKLYGIESARLEGRKEGNDREPLRSSLLLARRRREGRQKTVFSQRRN